MSMLRSALIAFVAGGAALSWIGESSSVTGIVRLADGNAAGGALVTFRAANYSTTVIADRDGRYSLDGLADGTYEVAAGFGGITGDAASVTVQGGAARAELVAAPLPAGPDGLPASAILSLLPDGEEKRRFIRDCTGCHGLDARIAFPEGKAQTRESWVEKTALMLSFAGPSSNFPVIGAGREPEATADFLTRHIRDGASFGATPRADAAAAGATITEYAIPEAGDLPHDLAALPDGRVLITGMFTHRMYLLNPETGTFETEAIPVENANPRAVELGDDGAWWVVLGNPRALARRDADSGEWTSWTVGTYPHSLGVARDGRVWFNGHFSRNPEVLGWLDAATGEVTRLDVPAHPQAGEGAGPIPYELRVAPDGRIWGSELVGDRVFAYQPANGQFQVWPMPGPVSGPRRLDVAPDGSVWIPEYAAGYLTRLDPANGRFERFAVPVADAAPYIARVDARTGRVWLGTGAADAIFAFDPASGRWTTYPLPSRATLVRHLAIDPRTGDLWIAYGASPGPPSKVARLRVRSGT